MHLPSFIASRYLFAKKSHNVINIISAISAIGMAIGTAALIIILSVYNGFDRIITDTLDETSPDLQVTPVQGKFFAPAGAGFDWLAGQTDVVERQEPVLEDEVFLLYDGVQSVAPATGVEDLSLRQGDIPLCAIGPELAYEMGINPNFVTMLELYYPMRDRNISLSNPESSLKSVRVKPGRILAVNAGGANSALHIPLGTMRELLGCTDEVSSLDLYFQPDAPESQRRAFTRELKTRLGDGFSVRTRIEQNETLFKMMRYEKAVIFLILLFVILIIAFNVFGSLSMLIIEKKEDIRTLYSLGMRERQIRQVFILEGWMISLLGLAAGLVIGLAVALLQQRFGLIPMPGGFVVQAYPIIIKGSDVLITALSVALIGYLIAMLPAKTTDPTEETA